MEKEFHCLENIFREVENYCSRASAAPLCLAESEGLLSEKDLLVLSQVCTLHSLDRRGQAQGSL